MDKLRTIIESVPMKIISIVSTFLGLFLNSLRIFGITNDLTFSIVGIVLFLLGFIFMCICLFLQHIDIHRIEEEKKQISADISDIKKKNLDLENKYNGLLEVAYNGMEFTYNAVTINFDEEGETYRFQFEKHFKIITDIVPEYYSAQFYANKFITNKDMAKAFYEQNCIPWKDLKVRACISYRLPGEERFSNEYNLDIINISDNTNYIIFKIMYKIFRTGVKIDLAKGAEVKIKYCYIVPITYWGSYINRTISYFGEEAKVILKYNSNSKLNYRVLKLRNGSPFELDKKQYDVESYHDDDRTVITISLSCKPHEQSKFRITWDADSYFQKENLNTEDGIDQLGLTNK